jgi:hypothetical protein
MTTQEQAAKDPSRFIEPKRTTAAEVGYRQRLEDYFSTSPGSNVEKLQNFAKYVPVQDMRRFLGRCEIFQRVLHVHGSILECGVLMGGGLMTWALLSEIYEPVNHLRNIVGFDTFQGFASVAAEDRTMTAVHGKVGGLAVDAHDDLQRSIELYDENRLLRHIPKVKLVRGDIRATAPQFLEQHPHTVVSLLWLDFDTFEPTVAALEQFVPRMPKGAVIAFDELNHEVWPGETVAVMKTIGLRNLRVERLPWGSTVSFAVLD